MFTSTASDNYIGASIHGFVIAVNAKLLPILESVVKHDNRIVSATFKGNPKTTVVACYSPHNACDESITSEFYQKLSQVIDDVPLHSMLFIGGDMNAQVATGFSYHSSSNRNGILLHDFIHQHSLLLGNTLFQKKPSQLWTHRSPAGSLSQIDFVLFRKRWRNSVKECRAFSSSNSVGSDHRMVTASVKLSVRRPALPKKKHLFWKALALDKKLATNVGSTISERFNNLSPDDQVYSNFVDIANDVGTKLLPKRPQRPTQTVDCEPVVTARKATLRASTQRIQSAQKNLRKTFDSYEDKRINNILRSFETPAAASVIKNAWDLVKTLSGKKSRSTIFIEGDDRLKTWENHFKNLLNAEVNAQADLPPIQKIFDTFPEIDCGDLTQDEVDAAVRILKNGKAPGLDGLPPEFWKLPDVKSSLLRFCNETFHGNRPKEWGISGLTPIPKKGDLKKTDNYRGISLTQIAAKIYNRCLLNRIRPVIDRVLRTNQNGFRKGRSTTSHLLALRRIVEELKNHDKEAVITFIDFRKAFDSINRERMFEILRAYGIPSSVVDAIHIMYKDTFALVITPEGETGTFKIDTGVLQGDPLAPFLFIIVLDYALRTSITSSDGLTLKPRQSRRYPAEKLADLDYADDIALLEDCIESAQDLLKRVEKACQEVGLYLNAPKTQYMHLNPASDAPLFASDGSKIDCVDDFKYLGGYTDTEHDMSVRIALAWSALHSLQTVWKSPIKKTTKTKVFKACIETILLYGSDSWTLNMKRKKRLDGTYTRMLRMAYNISWKSHPTNKFLYGSLPKVTEIVRQRRLSLVGHVSRHDEPAGRLLLWSPAAKRRAGRPCITLKNIIEEETGLCGQDLLAAMADRERWHLDHVCVSPEPSGIG